MQYPVPAELLGYAASFAVLATFLMRTMRPLRLVAILSNLLFIAYGCVEHLEPIFLLHLALLPINAWRLVIHWRDGSAPPVQLRSQSAAASRPVPYGLVFAVGVLIGLIAPLPFFLVVGKSEAAKLVLPFVVKSAPVQPSGAPLPLEGKSSRPSSG